MYRHIRCWQTYTKCHGTAIKRLFRGQLLQQRLYEFESIAVKSLIFTLRPLNAFPTCRASPWSPRASITFSQPHVCGSHALQPRLWATDILSCSSDSRRPTDVIGDAASKSPECGDAAARSLALSMSVEAWDQTSCACFLQTSLSHALWICTDSVAGVEFPDRGIHLFSAIEMESLVIDVLCLDRCSLLIDVLCWWWTCFCFERNKFGYFGNTDSNICHY